MSADLYWKMLDDIKACGRTVLSVFPDEDTGDYSFSYSVGNSIMDLPELLLFAMHPRDARWLINLLSEQMIERGRKFDDGELVSMGGPCPVCVIDASDSVKNEYTIQVKHMLTKVGLENEYRVMQIVLPDPDGLFPWDDGCSEPYAQMKVCRRLAS
jgi:hypothetical protein